MSTSSIKCSHAMRRLLQISKFLGIILRKITTLSDDRAKYFKDDFDYRKVHIKNIHIKIAPRHWLNQYNTLNKPLSRNWVFLRKSKFLGILYTKGQLQRIPTIGANHVRANIDWSKVHIKNKLFKITIRRWLIQPNTLNRPFSHNRNFS